MTNEDAISRDDALLALTGEIPDGMTVEEYIARISKRLRELPSVQPVQPCEDVIVFDNFQEGFIPCIDAVSREAILNILKQEDSEIEQFLAEQVRALPIVQPERLKGEWIESEFDESVYCSECNAQFENKYRFCPHCGADMK